MNFTEDQYHRAKMYVEDMKDHKRRVYWIGKENKSDEELILMHVAHQILSGFYYANEGYGTKAILEMENAKINSYQS